jgi:hypothetical protein
MLRPFARRDLRLGMTREPGETCGSQRRRKNGPNGSDIHFVPPSTVTASTAIRQRWGNTRLTTAAPGSFVIAYNETKRRRRTRRALEHEKRSKGLFEPAELGTCHRLWHDAHGRNAEAARTAGATVLMKNQTGFDRAYDRTRIT